MRVTELPKPGQKISLTIKTKSYVVGTDPIRIIKYENAEVLPYRFDDPPRCVRIRTEPLFNYPHTDSSVICFDEVIEYSIDGVPYVESDTKITELKPRSSMSSLKITGSSGDIYNITVVNGKAVACTCKGFSFRSNCRHLREAQDVLDGKFK